MYERVGSHALQLPADFDLAGWDSVPRETLREWFPDFMPGLWQDAQLAVIEPHGQVIGHVDKFFLQARYHLVLANNPGCWSLHDGSWQQLEVGGVYTINPTQFHGAVNWGPTARVHLVVDV